MQILTQSCLFICLFGSILSCTSLKTKNSDQFKLQAKKSNEFSVLEINVENLFDEHHDEGKNDFTYLPLVDKNSKIVVDYCEQEKISYRRSECFNLNWDTNLVEFKLKQIAQIIASVDECPDNVMLIEVENINILHRLNLKLPQCHYVTEVLIEGNDDRGIDLALLSKFEKAGEPQLISLELSSPDRKEQEIMSKLRGILVVPLKTPNGIPFSMIGAHLPSQNNPRIWREHSVNKLKIILSELNNKTNIITLGDFNITDIEDQETGFISKELAQIGKISHLVGCQHCEGTHSYRQSWSFLDLILSGTKNTSIQIIPESVTTIKNSINSDQYGRPIRFSADKKIGVSDHLPLFARFHIANQ